MKTQLLLVLLIVLSMSSCARYHTHKVVIVNDGDVAEELIASSDRYCQRRYFSVGEVSACERGRVRRQLDLQRRRERTAYQRGYNRSFYWSGF
jgi:hypothetical protein